MKMLFQSLTNGGFVQLGQFLMLFMVALLLLYLLDEKRCVVFKQYAFLMLLVLLCPVTAKLLVIYQTPFYSTDNLWELLPVTPLLAYALVVATVKIVGALTSQRGRWQQAITRKKESVLETFVIMGLSLVLFLCGTLEFGKAMTEEATGNATIPANVCEVLKAMELPEEGNVKIVAVDEVARWARIYSGRILLPYGRNLYEPEMTAFTYEVYTEEAHLLHDWVNGELSSDEVYQGADFYGDCAANGYEYLIFAAGKVPDESGSFYEQWAETADYVIYKLQ